ncbi:MAG: class I SAM-dependent methyltransferase [Nannocystales bacterium]
MSRTFVTEPLAAVVAHVRACIATEGSATIEVPDPDLGQGQYPGECSGEGQTARRHRPLRVWTDLADRLELRLHTPVRRDSMIALSFSKLDPAATLLQRNVRGPGKYAPSSGFGRVSKLEDPDFLIDFDDALERCALGPRPRVLSLGVNRGDELVPVLDRHDDAVCTGIDHDAEALGVARERLGAQHRFIESDLNELPELPRHDLVVCIDTLQSPGVEDRVLLRHMVQNLLEPRGCVILGLPNCRYLDGELLHGTRMVNFRQPELSLLLKAAAFYKKYFQQHHKRVFVTGKHELLITAIPRDPA